MMCCTAPGGRPLDVLRLPDCVDGEVEAPPLLLENRNLSYQQDVSIFDIAIVVLVARSNSVEDLRPLATQILQVLGIAERGRVTLVGG